MVVLLGRLSLQCSPASSVTSFSEPVDLAERVDDRLELSIGRLVGLSSSEYSLASSTSWSFGEPENKADLIDGSICSSSFRSLPLSSLKLAAW